MAVREVRKMGDPVLLQVAAPVEKMNTPELQELITDMHDTMIAMDGAGIAAPQIGVSLQVVMFGFEHSERYPNAEPVPFTILVNPKLYPIGEDMENGWEGCLSVPGLRGVVPRHKSLRYTGLDEKGNAIDRTVSDFHARVVQHECDHLQGILYPMRIRDMRLFGFVETLFPGQDLQDE